MTAPTREQIVDFFIFDAVDQDVGYFSRASTEDVANHFGIDPKAAYNALNKLATKVKGDEYPDPIAGLIIKTRDVIKKHQGKTAVGFQQWEYYWTPEDTERHGAGKMKEEASQEIDFHQAGFDHAQEQMESDYFRDWVHEQLNVDVPGGRITDPRQIARNMLQQLVWDTARGIDVTAVVGRKTTRDEFKEFMDGFRENAQSKAAVDWLTEIVEDDMPQKSVGMNEKKSNDLESKIRNAGGQVRFGDRLKRMNPEAGPRWTAFVTVFGRDVTGEGNTKSEAISHAVANLPPDLSRHFGFGGLSEAVNEKKSPSEMTAGEINRELDAIGKKRQRLNDKFIEAGRGSETSIETRKKTDPLALEYIALMDRFDALHNEIDRRMGPGPGGRRWHRMGKGFGPMREEPVERHGFSLQLISGSEGQDGSEYQYGPAKISVIGGGRLWHATVRFSNHERDFEGRSFDEAVDSATFWIDSAPELQGWWNKRDKDKYVERQARRSGLKEAREASNIRNQLSTIKILFRTPDDLSLYGIPYKMRPDIGQEPRHLWKAGQTKGWIWLGTPGWYGSMSNDDVAAVKAFLAKHKGDVPGGPYEWTEL